MMMYDDASSRLVLLVLKMKPMLVLTQRGRGRGRGRDGVSDSADTGGCVSAGAGDDDGRRVSTRVQRK